ncbi:MAG: YicC/YloC family endoribonuclease [Candidatus Adiutrix sp.]
MIKSMTGFGTALSEFSGRTITVEVKSANNRFREVVVRAPKICAPLEEAIKKRVALKIERGRVDLWVQLDERDLKKRSLAVDLDLAFEVKRLLTELQEALDLTGPITLDHILPHGVIGATENTPGLDEMWQAMLPSIDKALDVLVNMRQNEGLALADDLQNRLNTLGVLGAEIQTLAAKTPNVLFEKLISRLNELTANLNFDPARLAQEAAFLADKADITEEVVRLNSHIDTFYEFIADAEAKGRRLDFLLQEMGREVNTMGSKAQDARISTLVLSMKAELEKLREQVQNIE